MMSYVLAKKAVAEDVSQNTDPSAGPPGDGCGLHDALGVIVGVAEQDGTDAEPPVSDGSMAREAAHAVALAADQKRAAMPAFQPYPVHACSRGREAGGHG